MNSVISSHLRDAFDARQILEIFIISYNIHPKSADSAELGIELKCYSSLPCNSYLNRSLVLHSNTDSVRWCWVRSNHISQLFDMNFQLVHSVQKAPHIFLFYICRCLPIITIMLAVKTQSSSVSYMWNYFCFCQTGIKKYISMQLRSSYPYL